MKRSTPKGGPPKRASGPLFENMTVVGVGENLRDQYKVGDRFIIQADVYDQGINWAYGYMYQGGMSQYNVIDHRILDGDHGNYLIPVQDDTGLPAGDPAPLPFCRSSSN